MPQKIDAATLAQKTGLSEEVAKSVLGLINAREPRSTKYIVFLPDWKKEAIEAEFPDVHFIRPKRYQKAGEG